MHRRQSRSRPSAASQNEARRSPGDRPASTATPRLQKTPRRPAGRSATHRAPQSRTAVFPRKECRSARRRSARITRTIFAVQPTIDICSPSARTTPNAFLSVRHSPTISRYRSSKMCSGNAAPGNSTMLRGNRGIFMIPVIMLASPVPVLHSWEPSGPIFRGPFYSAISISSSMACISRAAC